MADYVVADATFDFGESGSLRAGTIYRADDPLVRAHPEWFTDLEESGLLVSTAPKAVTVEAATAAPGEKRATKRAANK